MNLFPPNVNLLSTTRSLEGGCSKESFINFNLALHVGDSQNDVLINRTLLESHYNLPSSPVWVDQIHSNITINAESVSTIVTADASYTSKSGIVCAVLTADCLPVFISNLKGTVVGIAHAGWRGMIDGVIESLIDSIGFDGKDLVVHLGPAISQLSFEVGVEVKSQYLDKNINFDSCFTVVGDRNYLDLYHAARLILSGYGIKSISGGEHCTYRESDQYFSYRRDGKNSGRMAHLIWIE